METLRLVDRQVVSKPARHLASKVQEPGVEAVMTRVGEYLAAFTTATAKKRKPKEPKTRRRY